MSRAIHVMGLFVALAAVGCEEKKEPAAAGAAATPAGAAAQAEELPTEADFEEEAQKEISKDNVDGELDKLEKEIGQ